MVGDVTLQDGRLFWAGLWADSEADLAAGKGKKFKYGGPEGQTAAALTQMPSGEWHGYFFNPGDEGDTKCKEKGVKLKFDGNQARGGGENQFGEFSLKGSYDASTKKMTLRKAYLYQDDDDDDDEIVDAEPEDVAAEIAGLEGDAEIPIEELQARGRLRGGGAQGQGRQRPPKVSRVLSAWPAATERWRPPPQVLDADLLAVKACPVVQPGSRAAAC